MELRTAAARFLDSPALSEGTRRAYRVDVGEFCGWLDARGTTLEQVDIRVFVEYASHLGASRPGRRPRKLAPATISRKLAAIRAFLRHSLGAARVPDARVAPRRGRRLPEATRGADLDKELLALEGEGPIPLRNRALVELVYSAG
ncbi:MAG: integrase/recombinase XerD, partial [Gaiellaceae bacterium]|nr:integrase/recombinase XerD [Gaiellaceae bacterium]